MIISSYVHDAAWWQPPSMQGCTVSETPHDPYRRGCPWSLQPVPVPVLTPSISGQPGAAHACVTQKHCLPGSGRHAAWPRLRQATQHMPPACDMPCTVYCCTVPSTT